MRKGQQSKNLEDVRARTTGTKKAPRLSTYDGPFQDGNPFQHAAIAATARMADRQMLRESKNPFGAAMEKAARSDKVKVHEMQRKKSRLTKGDAKWK